MDPAYGTIRHLPDVGLDLAIERTAWALNDEGFNLIVTEGEGGGSIVSTAAPKEMFRAAKVQSSCPSSERSRPRSCARWTQSNLSRSGLGWSHH